MIIKNIIHVISESSPTARTIDMVQILFISIYYVDILVLGNSYKASDLQSLESAKTCSKKPLLNDGPCSTWTQDWAELNEENVFIITAFFKMTLSVNSKISRRSWTIP